MGRLIHPQLGSIPACAGETRAPHRQINPVWVYPRLCGGNQPGAAVQGTGRGLSPLVRGKRLQFDEEQRNAGSIPACAGETLVFNIMIC